MSYDYRLKVIRSLCADSLVLKVYRDSLAPARIRAIENVDRIYGLPVFTIREFLPYTIERYESVYGSMEIEDLS